MSSWEQIEYMRPIKVSAAQKEFIKWSKMTTFMSAHCRKNVRIDRSIDESSTSLTKWNWIPLMFDDETK